MNIMAHLSSVLKLVTVMFHSFHLCVCYVNCSVLSLYLCCVLIHTHTFVFTTNVSLDVMSLDITVMHCVTSSSDACPPVCSLIRTFIQVTCAYLLAQMQLMGGKHCTSLNRFIMKGIPLFR